MKKFAFVLVALMVSVAANAQFEKGKKYIGASMSGLNLSYSGSEKTHFGLQAKGGYLVADNLMATGLVGYDKTGDFPYALTLGVGGRYYIVQNGLYLGLGAMYAHGDNGDGDFKTDNFFVTPEVGYSFFINEYLTIEPAVYYRMSLNEFSDGSTVGLKIGLGYYF